MQQSVVPVSHHVEDHFSGADLLRDIVLGMSDGLTVPFALAAGLTGAVLSSRVIVVAGLAEIAAGAVAMGLGGFLAGKSALEHYASELSREQREIIEKPEMEKAELREIFESYGLKAAQSESIIETLARDPKAWVDFMMRFELNLEAPDPGRAWKSGLTIALAYVLGGLIPLFPYWLAANPLEALRYSILLTAVALFFFGFFRGKIAGTSPWRGACQTLLIGALAGSVAFALAKIVAT
jgi:VIT1/CCC1 family predicted Fe2+/Mn2+ transporter